MKVVPNKVSRKIMLKNNGFHGHLMTLPWSPYRIENEIKCWFLCEDEIQRSCNVPKLTKFQNKNFWHHYGNMTS